MNTLISATAYLSRFLATKSALHKTQAQDMVLEMDHELGLTQVTI